MTTLYLHPGWNLVLRRWHHHEQRVGWLLLSWLIWTEESLTEIGYQLLSQMTPYLQYPNLGQSHIGTSWKVVHYFVNRVQSCPMSLIPTVVSSSSSSLLVVLSECPGLSLSSVYCLLSGLSTTVRGLSTAPREAERTCQHHPFRGPVNTIFVPTVFGTGHENQTRPSGNAG